MFVYMCYFKLHSKCFYVYVIKVTLFFPTVLVIQKAYRQNTSGFHFEEKGWRTRIDIASSNFKENGSY